MKRAITETVLLLICFVVADVYAGATTCVANKKFKVREVCGRVTDPSGVPIPQVDIELLDMRSVVFQRAITNENGIFKMPNVSEGQYVLRVQYAGFAVAWQPFIVTKSNPIPRCSKPMQVRLEPAGRCSSVSYGKVR